MIGTFSTLYEKGFLVKLLRTLSVCFLALALSACGLLGKNTPATPSPESTHYSAPKLYAYPFALQKTLNADIHTRFKTSEIFFETSGQLKSDNHSISLTFTANNQVIWLIEYNGETINEVRTSEIPEEFQAQDLLRDLTLSLWPEAAISRQLKNSRLIQTDLERSVVDEGNKPLIRVTYSMGASTNLPNGRIIVDNFVQAYQLVLDCKRNF